MGIRSRLNMDGDGTNELTKKPDHRAAIFLSVFAIISTLLGGLFYNPYDPVAYVWGAEMLLHGNQIYTHHSVVYPPFLYSLATPIFFVLEQVGGINLANGYYAFATFAGLATFAHIASYLFGRAIIRSEARHIWIFAGLFNPFALFVMLLFGQMEVAIILGLAGALYGSHTDQYFIGGFSLAVAASVKIYPIVLFIPYLIHNRHSARQIVLGALPVFIFTGVLFAALLPESLSMFGSPPTVRPVNLLYIITQGSVSIIVTDLLFKSAFIIATVLAVILPIDDDLRLVLPLVPVALLYPDIIEYRWLPLAYGLLLVGYLPATASGLNRSLTAKAGWAVTVLGCISMVIGSVEGWLEGKPWVVPTLWDWPGAPVMDLTQFQVARQTVAIIVGVLVIVCLVRSVAPSETENKGVKLPREPR